MVVNKLTLYEKLIAIEEVNDRIEYFESKQRKLVESNHLKMCAELEQLGITRIPAFYGAGVFRLSDEGILLAQRQVISDSSLTNGFVRRSTHKIETIAHALETLAKGDSYLRRLFPRRENIDYNLEVQRIGEIVDIPHFLFRRGLRAHDSFVGNLAFMSIALYLIGAKCTELSAGGVDGLFALPVKAVAYLQQITNDYLFPALGVMSGTAMGISEHKRQRSGELPLDQARYVDAKISQLFH